MGTCPGTSINWRPPQSRAVRPLVKAGLTYLMWIIIIISNNNSIRKQRKVYIYWNYCHFFFFYWWKTTTNRKRLTHDFTYMIKYLHLTDNSISLTLNTISLRYWGLHTKAALGPHMSKSAPGTRASLNHRKMIKAEPVRLIPRKHATNLVLLIV